MSNKVRHGYKLKHNEPFIFYGDNGDYEIKPLEKLEYDGHADIFF